MDLDRCRVYVLFVEHKKLGLTFFEFFSLGGEVEQP